MTFDELVAAITDLRRQLDQSRAENVRLREALDELREGISIAMFEGGNDVLAVRESLDLLLRKHFAPAPLIIHADIDSEGQIGGATIKERP